MKVSFENPDKINGLLTITVEEADYKNEVDQTLKDYRKKANVPGFRPGQVPMGMIKRQYGGAVKMDAINKIVGEQINKYITDNKINMLGQPLASEAQQPQDLEKEGPYTFIFDIAVAPEFEIELTSKDKIDYYDINVDDALIDRQVEMFASRLGKNVDVEEYADGDVIKGDLRELDKKGNTKEDGLTVEAAMVMPEYIKAAAQKKLFKGAKVGDIITFNPRKAYKDSDAEMAALLKIEKDKLAEHEGDFSYQITNIQRFENHAIDQELFDQTFGKDQVKDEKAFRAKIAEGLKGQLEMDSDYKFLQDVRKYAEEKVGQLTYPDALLKRMMKENNKEKDQEFIDKNYDASIKELTWSLIRNRLSEKAQVKVNDEDVRNAARETARVQFAQYGMNNVPDEYVNNYADELLKKQESVQQFVDRAIDLKLIEAFKKTVKLNKKSISLDDFNKMMSE
ncbi:MAG: trigger factor [Prevotella sp.]|jgi:trigger factor|nr:trigger factor [Prevotella sp.]